MKKLWTSAVVVMLLIMSLAFADYSYIVKSYKVDKESIDRGNSFNLTIDMESLNLLDTEKTLTLVNTSEDSFRLASGGTSHRIGRAMPKLDPEIKLIYQGEGNTFTFNIIEDATGNVIASDKVTIKEANPSSSSSHSDNRGSTNTSEYQPNFDMKKDPFNFTFDSNKYYQVTAKLKNISKYDAKNVRAQIIAGDDALPFNLEASTLRADVRNVSDDKSGDFVFILRVDKTASSKTYNLKLKLDFDNYHGNHYTQEIPLNIIVNSSERKPVVTIFEHKVEGGELETNVPTKLHLDFILNGTFKAKNINVTLGGFSADGITLASGSTDQYIPFLDPNEHARMSYNIMAMPKASGVQTLTAKINYIDNAGNSYEREEQIFINLISSAEKTVDDVAVKFSSKAYNINAGGQISVNATVTNHSQNKIQNLKVALNSPSGINVLSSYINYINELNAGESKTFTYIIGADSGASESTQPLEITVASGDDDNKKQLDVTAISVTADNGKSGKSKPKIIISQYDYGDKTVLAGQVFPLTVTFTNTSKSMGIRNVKASFTSADNVFLPVESANSFYIDAIPAGGSVTQTVNLITKNDTQPKIYSVDFEMNYEDDKGKSYDANDQPYKDTEQITINVKQLNRLEVAELGVPEMAMMGEEIPLDVNFFNMGKSTMYNLLVTLEGDFDKRDATRFVGTFEPGANEYFSASIIPSAEGEQKGKLKFTFEDANGEAEEVIKEITIMVEGGMIDDGMGMGKDFNPDEMGMGEDFNPDEMGMDGEQKAMPNYVKYLIGAAALIAAVTAVVIVKRKKRKKQLLESLDED